MTAEKKVSAFLGECGVPSRLRPAIPILAAGDRIVWVCGLRLDDRARITSGTTRAARLRFHARRATA